MVCLALLAAAFGAPAQVADPGALDPRFAPDQRIEADTALGRLSIGVSGVTENERQQSTTGDVEFGTLYRVEIDSEFPRVAELRPFVFNRIESTEASYYESLGIGFGLRASVREKHERNNWFVRVSTLTPSELYIERYSQNGQRAAVLELFAGWELPIGPMTNTRDMRTRIARPTVVTLTLPPALFDTEAQLEPGVLERVHVLMAGAYLSRVYQLEADSNGPATVSGWPVLRMIERVSGEGLSDYEWRVLQTGLVEDPTERAARRRLVVEDALRRGLTAMMRGPYPLVFEPSDARGTRVAKASRPGMGWTDARDPLNVDAMIDHYIRFVTSRIE